MTAIQIVPALPPATNGVGDYALAVGCVMRREFGLNTLFVVGSDRWEGPEEVEGFRVLRVTARSATHLAEALDAARAMTGSSSVLLQMSGYGYAGRGCPWWLLQGVKRWRAKQLDSRLVTMFHESYAFGPPWKSAFWLSPPQKMTFRGIAKLSDIAVTNIELYRERLERFDASKQGEIAVLAVPSNVGEPSEPRKLDARAKNMVVFGQPPLRKQTYQTQMAGLQLACEQLGIAEVHDVGASFDAIPERVGDLRVRRHGLVSVSDLSLLLSDAAAGFVTYSRESLAKSGVFAAYCAHRLVPVLPNIPQDRGPDADGIQRGIHYLSVDGKLEAKAALPPNPQSIADAAWSWYSRHSLHCHAQVFASALARSL